MVRKNTLKNINLNILVTAFSLCMLLSLMAVNKVSAEVTCVSSNNLEACNSETTFNVNINEVLTVSITRPSSWATGSANTLLTNKVGLSIISNNPAGFTATMKSNSVTPNLVNLVDRASIIPTLSSEVYLYDSSDSTGAFPSKQWGYGVVSSGSSAPLIYYAMAGKYDTPVLIANSIVAANKVTKDIYFAAKAGGGISAGTYSDQVVVSVVSGVISDDNPVNPTDPIVPGDDIANDGASTETSHGGTEYGAVVTTTTDGDTTTTESYAKPAGVTTATMVDINEGTPLAISLAVIAGVAAVAGTVFFVIAKRTREEENEDSDY